LPTSGSPGTASKLTESYYLHPPLPPPTHTHMDMDMDMDMDMGHTHMRTHIYPKRAPYAHP